MVSPHFPPDTSAGTHRVRLLAPHLAACGWEPVVVTVDPAFYEGQLDPDLEGLVPPTLRVIRAPAWSAATTRRFGMGDLGLRALTGLRAVSDRLLERERFHAIYITVYPTYPALLGPHLKARHDLPFVLDYQDPWVGAWGRDVGGGVNGSPDFRSRMSRAVAVRIEPRVVRRADGLTAVSARTYEDVLARVPDARPRVCAPIPLGFEEADFEALRRAPRVNRLFDPHDGLAHVCYVGTVLPTGFPVLRAVLAAARELRRSAPEAYARLRLHFIGTSNQRDAGAAERVTPVARELGVDAVVHEVPGRVDYLDALNVQVQASALLLMGGLEPHYTPSKVFPALLSRRPIVAAYHKASSVLEVLRCDDVAAQVSTFSGPADVHAMVPELTRALDRVVRGGLPPASASTMERLSAWSARALAGRLGEVLDAVAA